MADADAMNKEVRSLVDLLRRTIAVYEAWLPLCQAKRRAIASADAESLNAVIRQENEKLQAIGELEKQRLNLVASLTQRVDPRAAAPMKMVELADALAEPERSELLMTRIELRERMHDVHRQSSIARRATESLARHMTSTVRSVAAVAAGVTTYSARGEQPARRFAVRTLNTTA